MNPGAFVVVGYRLNARLSCLLFMQDAEKDKAVMADKAKADTLTIAFLKGKLASHKQVAEEQQRNLEAASTHFKSRLTALQQQLEEQQKRVAVKEEQQKNITAAKDKQVQEQLQEAASSKADLMQVMSASHLFDSTGEGMPCCCLSKHPFTYDSPCGRTQIISFFSGHLSALSVSEMQVGEHQR